MLITLFIAFFALIALMIIHEFGHFIIAKKFKVKVEEFGIGYPPRIFGKKIGETLYSINLVPLGAFVKIYGEEGEPSHTGDIDDYRSFSNLKIWKRILICLGGVLAFWIAAIIIFSVAFGIGASIPVGDQDIQGVNAPEVVILKVQDDSPASQGGLQAQDKLLKMTASNQEVKINKIADFQKFVQDNKGVPIVFTVERQGTETTSTVTPRLSYPSDQGPMGVELERVVNIIEKYPWYETPLHGTLYTGIVTEEAVQGIYEFFKSLIQGKGVPHEAQVAGPVGITIFLSQAANYGVGFFLYFIGSLTVLLALFNLLPIPALDGGKILFLIIEKIKKKPISVQWEQGITVLFFVLLISMSLFITIKFDVPRVVDFWKAGL